MTTARKIAAIYYKMVTEKMAFRPEIMKENQEKYWRKKLNSLEKAKKQIKGQLAYYEINTNVVI